MQKEVPAPCPFLVLMKIRATDPGSMICPKSTVLIDQNGAILIGQ